MAAVSRRKSLLQRPGRPRAADPVVPPDDESVEVVEIADPATAPEPEPEAEPDPVPESEPEFEDLEAFDPSELIDAVAPEILAASGGDGPPADPDELLEMGDEADFPDEEEDEEYEDDEGEEPEDDSFEDELSVAMGAQRRASALKVVEAAAPAGSGFVGEVEDDLWVAADPTPEEDRRAPLLGRLRFPDGGAADLTWADEPAAASNRPPAPGALRVRLGAVDDAPNRPGAGRSPAGSAGPSLPPGGLAAGAAAARPPTAAPGSTSPPRRQPEPQAKGANVFGTPVPTTRRVDPDGPTLRAPRPEAPAGRVAPRSEGSANDPAEPGQPVAAAGVLAVGGAAMVALGAAALLVVVVLALLLVNFADGAEPAPPPPDRPPSGAGDDLGPQPSSGADAPDAPPVEEDAGEPLPAEADPEPAASGPRRSRPAPPAPTEASPPEPVERAPDPEPPPAGNPAPAPSAAPEALDDKKAKKRRKP